jgi:predicted RecB family nuclease
MLVANMRQGQRLKLRTAGITTIDELAVVSAERLQCKAGSLAGPVAAHEDPQLGAFAQAAAGSQCRNTPPSKLPLQSGLPIEHLVGIEKCYHPLAQGAPLLERILPVITNQSQFPCLCNTLLRVVGAWLRSP